MSEHKNITKEMFEHEDLMEFKRVQGKVWRYGKEYIEFHSLEDFMKIMYREFHARSSLQHIEFTGESSEGQTYQATFDFSSISFSKQPGD